MKNILLKYSLLFAGLFFIVPACTDLEEEIYSEVPTDNFFKTDKELIAAVGQAYSALSTIGNHGAYWAMNEIASDEFVITTKGSDWYDGGILLQLHQHEFAPDNSFFLNSWNFIFGGVNTCNRLIYQFSSIDTDASRAFQVELRGIRALFYYFALDAFGNVPLVTDFNDASAPGNNSDFEAGRKSIYNFVEKELNEIIPLLPDASSETYARINKPTALAIRVKLYLNAEVYTGTAQWDKVIADVDEIKKAGYTLMSNYRDNFAIENSNSTENIFVVSYDKVNAKGFGWPMIHLHYASQGTFNFTAQPWNGYSTLEEFYNSYVDPITNPGPQGKVWKGLCEAQEDGTLDDRLNNFIVGPQYNLDGSRTVDPSPEDTDPDGNPLTYTPRINEIYPMGWRQGGARCHKYVYEIGGTENISNDFVVFRYSDMLLAKAEALYRTGITADALALVNEIRIRAGVYPFTELTDDNLLAERGREMFAEMTRRQDLIRFDKFGSEWWSKKVSSAKYEVFPIPQQQIDANAKLIQNPGF